MRITRCASASRSTLPDSFVAQRMLCAQHAQRATCSHSCAQCTSATRFDASPLKLDAAGLGLLFAPSTFAFPVVRSLPALPTFKRRGRAPESARDRGRKTPPRGPRAHSSDFR
eukprot:6205697-Pleurochrysis_carterae.AAC.1